jgi:hypothetical protein
MNPEIRLEMATQRWVVWFNNHRLFGPMWHILPAETDANFYAASRTSIRSHDSNETSSRKLGAIHGSILKGKRATSADQKCPIHRRCAIGACVPESRQSSRGGTPQYLVVALNLARGHLSHHQPPETHSS